MAGKCPHCGSPHLKEYNPVSLGNLIDTFLSPTKILSLLGDGYRIQRYRYGNAFIRSESEQWKTATIVECKSCKGLCAQCPHCKQVQKFFRAPSLLSEVICPNCSVTYLTGKDTYEQDDDWYVQS